jgi:hypothetical protein
MSDQRSFVSADQFHPDPYTQSRTAERTLNAAIIHADISRSYEEYLGIFDEFYADGVEGSGETMEEPIRGNGWRLKNPSRTILSAGIAAPGRLLQSE